MEYSKVDPELKKKIKGLVMEYTDRPQPELLIAVPNPHPDLEYKEHLESSEFTSLCPLAAAQPDYARITIEYVPGKVIVELKSLKFYLVSFRNVQIFHEAVIGQVFKDIRAAISPKELVVEGRFTTRGGVDTTVRCSTQDSFHQ